MEYKSINAAKYGAFTKILESHQLNFIAQIHTQGDTVTEHLMSFKELIALSLSFNPVMINSQSGSDSLNLNEKIDFFWQALEYQQRQNRDDGKVTVKLDSD